MDKLEQLLKENREMFNQTEPPSGHFERFEVRLKEKRRKSRTRELYRISRAAAIFLLLVSSTIFIYQQLTPKPNSPMALGDVSPKMADVEYFFTSQLDELIQTIQNYPSPDNKSINDEMLKEVEKLDDVYGQLKQQLGDYPGEDQIVQAMIQYYQTKLIVVQKILTQLKSIDSQKEINNKPNESINF